MANKEQIRFDPAEQPQYYAPLVYHKESWDDAWTLLPYVHPLEATWSIAPSLPTASILYRYGTIIPFGQIAWLELLKNAEISRHFIRIRFPSRYEQVDDNDDPEDDDAEEQLVLQYRDWYGVLDIDEDDLAGAVYQRLRGATRTVTTGFQAFSCYGLEKLLIDWPIRTSWMKSEAGAAVEINRALTFNRKGKPNRTLAQVDGTYLFEPDQSAATYWTTKDVVEYLIKRQVPRDSNGAINIPWTITGVALPDWDRPEVEQEQTSTFSLLNQMANRRQMFGWRTVVKDNTLIDDDIQIQFFSHADTDIVLPITGNPKLEKNTNTRRLLFYTDQLTKASLKNSATELYDQIIYRGARKLSIGTFSHADSTLFAGWNTTLQGLYDTGASTATGYDALEDEDKRRWNAEARSSPRFEEVYAFFKIPLAWNRNVKNGEGGTANPMFPDGDGNTKAGFYPDMFVQPTLPFIQGQDYSLGKIADGTASLFYFSESTNQEEMPPLVFFKRPGSSRWVAGDKMALAGTHDLGDDSEDNRFSCSIQVPHESHGVLIRVTGHDQYAIAHTDFNSPLPVDEPAGLWDWRHMVVTIALPWDEYVEGKWPTTIDASIEAPRIKIVDAGERYVKHYVAPGTVVDVDRDGALVRSTGGYLPREGNDDHETQLKALAKLSHSWYGAPHRALYLDTHRLKTIEELDLGYLVTSIGDPIGIHSTTINTVISQIRISWPEGEEPPTFQLVTDAGELDAMQTAGDPAFLHHAPRLDAPAKLFNPNAPPIA